MTLHAVNRCRLLVQFQHSLRPPFRFFLCIKILNSHKQRPPRSLEQFVVDDFSGGVVNDTANKGSFVVEELDEHA